jgi:hypothetical protein
MRSGLLYGSDKGSSGIVGHRFRRQIGGGVAKSRKLGNRFSEEKRVVQASRETSAAGSRSSLSA